MMKILFLGQIQTFLDKKTSAPPRPTHEIECRHVQNLSEVLKISSVQPGMNFRVFYLLKPTVSSGTLTSLMYGGNFGGNFLAFNGKMTKALG